MTLRAQTDASLPSDTSERFDVAVIGAGIHGAAVAREAAARGLRVLVLEQAAVAASATSSKSSKLIHGGLRYLESGQLALVRECLREQAILLRTATPLVHRSDFFIPIYQYAQRKSWLVYSGLYLYALLGGRWPQRWPLTRAAALSLRADNLQALFSYSDAQTDDAALTRSVLSSAQMMGAHVKFSAKLERFCFNQAGAELVFRQHNSLCRMAARVVINAAGPWINQVAECADVELPSLAIELVRGTHIELPGAMPACCYLEAGDGRAVFALPWRGQRLIGTTECVFTGDPAQCQPSPKEIYYLLDVYNRYFADERNVDEVLNAWAGLRVLAKTASRPFNRARDAILLQDDARRPRYLAIYGGKLTSHRATAQRVVRALRYLPRSTALNIDTARQYLPLQCGGETAIS